MSVDRPGETEFELVERRGREAAERARKIESSPEWGSKHVESGLWWPRTAASGRWG